MKKEGKTFKAHYVGQKMQGENWSVKDAKKEKELNRQEQKSLMVIVALRHLQISKQVLKHRKFYLLTIQTKMNIQDTSIFRPIIKTRHL